MQDVKGMGLKLCEAARRDGPVFCLLVLAPSLLFLSDPPCLFVCLNDCLLVLAPFPSVFV